MSALWKWKPGDPAPVLTPAQKAENAALIGFVQAKHRDLVAFLKAKHPDDPRTQAVEALLAGVQELTLEQSLLLSASKSTDPTQIMAGGYNRNTGVMQLLVRNPNGALRSRGHMLSTYLHELAHCMDWTASGPIHAESWKTHFLWLLKAASSPPLNWEVGVACTDCGNYGVCSTADCAACVFAKCPATRPSALADVKPRQDYAKSPPSTYERVCTRQTRTWPWWKQACARMRAETTKVASMYAQGCMHARPVTPATARACATLKPVWEPFVRSQNKKLVSREQGWPAATPAPWVELVSDLSPLDFVLH